MVPERRMIAPCFVADALAALERQGLEAAPVLARAGLPTPLTGPVSVEAYGALWLGIAEALDDEFFGLSARPMRAGSFTLLCHAVLTAPTLERAVRRALRFLNLVLDDPRGELVVADGLAQIVLTDRGPPRPAFAYRTYWLILHGITCWLVGRRIPLRLVDFRCVEPAQAGDYGRFFGAPVHFAAPLSRLAFDARYLALPAVRDERALKAFLRAAPANILIRYRYDAGLAAQVRRRLRQQPPSLWPDFATLARQMAMPPSTLRHRLHQQGHSFRMIKDEIRRDLAIAWLDAGRPVGDIACDLGFTEPSAFHRLFRKWTGSSPGRFRRQGAVIPPDF